MGIFFEDLLPEFITIVTVFITVILTYFHHAYKYWEKRKIPFLKPTFPFGNTRTLLPQAQAMGIDNKYYYDQMKAAGFKFGGMYAITRPALVIVDLDYIKDIVLKDFQYFIDRGFFYNEKDDPISAHLFAVNESKWKYLRNKLTSTFTSGKMKMMLASVIECSGYMKDFLEKAAENDLDIDAKDVMARFTTDVIGSCAFGLDCNSFKDPDAEFRRMGQKIFEPTVVSVLRNIIIQGSPSLALMLKLKPVKKEVSAFFYKTVLETVKYREENNIKRPDFLQLLIDMKNDSSSGTKKFTMWEIVSQVFLFFIAGFDTSSTTMNFALYELARNPAIQKKVRDEINTILANHNDQITYECLSEMKYLQQVIEETLRMYPPVSTITRKCVQDYTLRDTDVKIEKGTYVIIPVYGIHMDPDLYPNPEKFDPERFTAENKSQRHQCAHIPFGEGPRNCIGLRFGIMQAKIGLITVIKNFELEISSKTQMPLHLDSRTFLLKSLEKLYLKAKKI